MILSRHLADFPGGEVSRRLYTGGNIPEHLCRECHGELSGWQTCPHAGLQVATVAVIISATLVNTQTDSFELNVLVAQPVELRTINSIPVSYTHLTLPTKRIV